MVTRDPITPSDVLKVAELATDFEFDAESLEYVSYHSVRFAENLNLVRNALLRIPETRPARILDIGPHFLTRCMNHFFGDAIVINTLGYFFHGMVPADIVDEHQEFDLNNAQFPTKWISYREQHDIIVMAEVIEHLHTAPVRVLKFLRSLMKDDGTLIVQTPNAVSWNRRVKLILGRNPYEEIRESVDNPGHFREYTEKELRSYCVDSGFTDPWIRKQNYWPTDLMSRLVGKILPNMREGFLLTTTAVPGFAPRPEGRADLDSSSAEGLSAEFQVRPTCHVTQGEEFVATAHIKNTGDATWLAEAPGDHGVVRVGGYLYDSEGECRGGLLSTDPARTRGARRRRGRRSAGPRVGSGNLGDRVRPGRRARELVQGPRHPPRAVPDRRALSYLSTPFDFSHHSSAFVTAERLFSGATCGLKPKSFPVMRISARAAAMRRSLIGLRIARNTAGIAGRPRATVALTALSTSSLLD